MAELSTCILWLGHGAEDHLSDIYTQTVRHTRYVDLAQNMGKARGELGDERVTARGNSPTNRRRFQITL